MSNSLYRCRAEVFIKPAGWQNAVRIPENEIVSISIDMKVPAPGQATSYRTGYALYEHNSNATVKIRDKFLLKAGWVALESAQRLRPLPEIPIPDPYSVDIEDLVTGFSNNNGLVEFFKKSISSTLIIDLYYPFGNVEKFLSQRYFFRIRSAEGTLGNGQYSTITVHGKDLYRSILSNARTNFAVKAGTPHEVVAGRILGGFATSLMDPKGKPNNDLVEVIEDNAPTKKIERDLRTNGQTPAATLANIEATYNVKFSEDPREPMRLRMIGDAPNRRSVFFLGIGLFEGYDIKTEFDVQGANNIRQSALALNNNSDVVDTTATEETEVTTENSNVEDSTPTGQKGTNPTSGANVSTYQAKTVTNVKIAIPFELSPFLSAQGELDSRVVYNIPNVGRPVTYDISKWFESRPGLKTEKWLAPNGSITTVQSAHAAFDSELLDRTRDIVTLFGGQVLARESNEAEGSGVITIKSDGYIRINETDYQIYEYYAHAIDHRELNERVEPGEVIAQASNKSPNTSDLLNHIHGSFYINFDGSRLYLNPLTAGKFAFRKQQINERKTNNGGIVGNNVYTESDALVRIVLAEARTTGLLGMALVARVILNRSCVVAAGRNGPGVFNSAGKSDIYNIVAARGQFEPTWSTTNNWSNAYQNATQDQLNTAKQAISLAQTPSQLKQQLTTLGGVSATTADKLILSTFFAASESIIENEVIETIEFKYQSFHRHFFGVARRIESPKSRLLCAKHSIETGNVGETVDTKEEGSTPGGTTGPSNSTIEGAIGATGGFVGVPELTTSFKGCPKALQIQPGFTFLVFDTREFTQWAISGGRTEQRFRVPIPDEYKDWAIIGMKLDWQSDLRVTLRTVRPLFGEDPVFRYTGADFKDIPEFGGDYYKYIRSFNNLCYRIVEGEAAGQNSCTLDTNINTVYNILGPKREEAEVSVNGDDTTPDQEVTLTGNETDVEIAQRVFRVNSRSASFIPTSGTVTSSFGTRGGGFHFGVDIGAPIGTRLVTPAEGTVLSAGPATGGPRGGTGIIITHGNGVETRYYHLSSVAVQNGQRVSAGQLIGKTGNTGGRTTGPHLHWEILVNGKQVDPSKVFTSLTLGARVP